jgi:hypothetical protein
VNWRLLAAGGVMLFGAILHGVVGDETLRKLMRLELPANRFGNAADTKVAMRITWHFGTIAFAVAGAWLVATSFRPHASFALGATYVSGTLLSIFGAIGGGVRIYRRGIVSLFKHPVVLLVISAALTWWGSTSL